MNARKEREGTAHGWLELVERSGLVVTEAVLDEVLPEGPGAVRESLQHWFRRQAEHYEDARGQVKALTEQGKDPKKARQAVRRWIDFVLQDFLEHEGAWAKGSDVPPSCTATIAALDADLKPDRVLLRGQKPALIVNLAEPGHSLDRKEDTEGQWRTSPTARIERLLRETSHATECHVGLVTNGEDWRLVYCPPGVSTGRLTWRTRRFLEERSTLQGFQALLGRDRLRPELEGADTLEDLCRRSLNRQAEVADRLGVQVREALEKLLLALDEADRKAGGKLLASMSESEIYEMLLSLMMRLVFFLYAEERGLLPHGEVLYDQGYGLTHLWQELHEDEERLDDRFDAWERILATCRLVHGGSKHADLTLRAYGGLLFDPRRYPVLEDEACRIPNRTVHEILDRLLFAREGRKQSRQRVGYWSLDVEEIGYLYEGLLDHRVARAGPVAVVKLRGQGQNGGEAGLPVTEIEARKGDALTDFVLEALARKPTEKERARIADRLTAGPDEADLAALARLPADVAERVRPFAPLIQCAEVAPPGWRYLTTGTSRRATGTHYTPQFLTERVVRTTLEPLVYRCEEGKPGKYVLEKGQRVLRSPREILDLKIADIAMGSGAFLVQVVRYLAERLVEAWDACAKEASETGSSPDLVSPYGEPSRAPGRDELLPFDDRDALRLLARRLIASRCVYGVDKNPLAVEMAKLSLWLITLSKDRPFTFIDHALKHGDSLVGASRRQIERWSLDEDRRRTQVELDRPFIEKPINDAARLRREIAALPTVEAEDAATKAALLEKAESTTEVVRLAGDLLIAPSFTTKTPREQESMRERHVLEFTAAAKKGAIADLRKRTDDQLGVQHPFHWFVEFPEVFDGDRGGFDAIVGNPPFSGGRMMRGTLGDQYFEFLMANFSESSGNGDLSAFFYRRGFSLLRPGGAQGLLATNTIAQGDTREMGLDYLVRGGASIFAAVRSMPWPGVASLEISIVHLTKGTWDGERLLDDRRVIALSTALTSGPAGKPHRLAANANLSFQGNVILGLGFTLSPEESDGWIRKNSRNVEVLQLYLNGEDLNDSPSQIASRWVINFGERSLGDAEHWPELLAILRDKVKPDREQASRFARKEWWLHHRTRPALYRTIAPLERVLVCCRVTKHLGFAFCPGRQVFADRLYVFATDKSSHFALLQSDLHEVWARAYSGTLETRLNYTPTDCFETFPFPRDLSDLETIGEAYHEHRRKLMLETQKGLTKTYNDFHDPECKTPGIVRLRELHVQLDNAVRDAYGWSDLDLAHGWQKTEETHEKKGKKIHRITWRYTISPTARDEILRRLLDLNRQRHEEEQALAPSPKPKKARTKRKAPPPPDPSAPRQLELF